MVNYTKRVFIISALIIFLAPAIPASSQSFGSFSFWGDSSVDAGNVMTMLLQSIPGLKPSDVPSITNGRFSNGPNWADYVASAFGRSNTASLLGGTDYGYGGAMMGQGYALVSDGGVEFYVPNTGNVIDQYRAGGGSFSANEVVFIYSGHNDALAVASTGVVSDPVVVAGELRANLEKLYSAGARQFVAPTLMALEYAPEIVQAGYSEAMAAWINVYDAAAAQVIAEFRAQHPDAVVLVPNAGALYRKIMASPAKYGFSNVTDMAFNEATGQAKPDADNYLWWNVHPTTKAQRLFAQEVLGDMGDYYYPRQMLPQAAAASMQLNRILAQETMKRASLRLRRSQPATSDQNANQIYATPYYGWGSQNGEAMALGFDWTAYGTDVGFQRRFCGSFTAGLNLDIHEADADMEGGGGDSNVKGMGITPYLGFVKDNWRADGGARYSRDDNNANRPIWLTGATARSDYDTESWAAWGEVGRDFSLADGITLTPLVNINWVSIDGVNTTENGADLLNSYLELDGYDSLRHLLGATLAASVAGVDLQLTAGWRHEYLDTRTQSSAELSVTTRTLDGPNSDHDGLAVDLQMNCQLPWGVSLELAYTGDYSQNANVQSVLLWLAASF